MDKEQNEINRTSAQIEIQDWAPVNEQGRHKSSDEIEKDIDRTRHSMDVLLDAIGGRFHPRSIIDRVLDYVQRPESRDRAKTAASDIFSNAYNTFQQNPVPVALITAGTLWLILGKKEPKRDYSGSAESMDIGNEPENQPTAGEKAQQAYQPVKEKLSSGLEAAKEKGRELKSKVQGMGESYKESASELRDKVSSSYRESISGVDHAMHENPFLFGVAAVFAGVVLGMLVPETQLERREIGEKSREAMDKIKQRGKEAFETVKEESAKTVKTIKEESYKKGISPDRPEERSSIPIQSEIPEVKPRVTPPQDPTLPQG